MNQPHSSVLLGLLTVFLWGSLATLGKLVGHHPPFFVLGVSFLIGAVPGLLRPRRIFTDWRESAWGIGGYFFYHFFLFYSFRFAPVLEANLINYLWPVILVLLTPLFFERGQLRPSHYLGGALAVTGCVVLLGGKSLDTAPAHLLGYVLAAGAALTWPLYSIGKKKFFPSASVWSVSGYCAGAGILCLGTHALLEPRVVLTLSDLWKIVVLGAGPFGLAFYAWDRALMLGDSRVIGALAYLTPIISSAGLLLFTDEAPTSATLWAMVLIIGGVLTGLLDFVPSKVLKDGEKA